MAETSKKPTIRFAGFADAWEQRKVGDCFSERVESDPNGELISATISSGIKKFSELGRHDNSNDDKSKYKKVVIGDIAYNSMRMWQGASGYSPYNGIVSPAYTVITPFSSIDSKFFAYMFKREDMIHTFQVRSQGITSDNWNLKFPALSEIEVTLPVDINEQKAISTYLTALDDLITLHQRELEKINELKRGLLQKLFPKNGQTTPEIRFPGFTDAWEQRKLSEIVERVVRKNTNNESSLPLTISAQYGLVDQITYFNNRVASRDISNYYLVQNGEFAYNKSTSDGFPFGAVKRLDLYPKGVLSTLYIVFALRDQEQTSSDFLSVFFDTDRWHRGVAERAAEGARNHGLLNISTEDFFDIDLRVPKEKREQDKIGALFRDLDRLITLHQRELEKLRNIKKACLEKMFV